MPTGQGRAAVNKDKKTPITQPTVRIKPVVDSKSDNPIISTKKAEEAKEMIQIGIDLISADIISNKWAEIIGVLQEKYPRPYNGLINTSFDLFENQIVLHVKSEHIKKAIEERLVLLTKHAQKVLNNKKVKFVFEIQKAKKEEKSLYLAIDKYKHYKGKNKNLEKLVEMFNLDI